MKKTDNVKTRILSLKQKTPTEVRVSRMQVYKGYEVTICASVPVPSSNTSHTLALTIF